MTIAPSTRLPSIGSLMHRLALEAPVRSPDGAGGARIDYALVAEVWGEIRALSGDEVPRADRLSGSVTHAIFIRHRDSMAPDQRFRLGNRRFDIRAILRHEGRRRFLECRCEEVVT